MRLQDLQVEIEDRLLRGETLSHVERDLIDGCTVSEDAKAALWLYGWCFLENDHRAARTAAHGRATGAK
jgi:hypothetical protein